MDWARNIRRKITKSSTADLTYQSSSVFALAWNAFRMQLPEEVMADFNKFLANSGITRMNPSGKKGKKNGEYTIGNAEEKVVFHDVELAPPAGFFGVNYTRYSQSSLANAILDQALAL